ncbi:MAG TPA: Hpt domain-containing protein [Methyloceanibacter sp.]|nr:Hpt domain-containing protein [Methyloceanibacter sp.]
MRDGTSERQLKDRAAVEAAEGAACIDLAHLSLFTASDRALIRELLDLFRSQSAAYLQRLAAATSDREWQEAAHSLKGSARAIGACCVSEAAERAEQLSGAALKQGRSASLQAIEGAIKEANAEIAALLACDF